MAYMNLSEEVRSKLEAGDKVMVRRDAGIGEHDKITDAILIHKDSPMDTDKLEGYVAGTVADWYTHIENAIGEEAAAKVADEAVASL